MLKKLGYMSFAKVKAQEKDDKDFVNFFKFFKDEHFLYKPYVGEIEYEFDDGEKEKTTIKALSIFDVENEQAIFQLINRQPFFCKEEMDVLNEMYNHFLEETEQKSVERC